MRFPNTYICGPASIYPIEPATILSAVTVDAYTVCNGTSPTGA